LFTALPATYLFFFQRPRRHRHPHSFPTRRSSDLSARILILEGAPQILGTFPAPLQHVARESLERLGVEVRTNSIVTTVDNRGVRSEEHTSELQSLAYLVCRLLLEKKKTNQHVSTH